MKKVMLLAAMLAMVLASAVPAMAQSPGPDVLGGAALGAQFGEGNVQCVQNAVNQQGGQFGGFAQYGDANTTNVNVQQIAQECNINTGVAQKILVAAAAPTATATPTATVTAAPAQYAAPVQYQYAAAAQYQYATALPPTGGSVPSSGLLALGAGALLVGGGLLARRIVR